MKLFLLIAFCIFHTEREREQDYKNLLTANCILPIDVPIIQLTIQLIYED
jgi:hypothetical protein